MSRALDAKEQRSGRIQKEILDDILDGTILIDTCGEAIGKLMALLCCPLVMHHLAPLHA